MAHFGERNSHTLWVRLAEASAKTHWLAETLEKPCLRYVSAHPVLAVIPFYDTFTINQQISRSYPSGLTAVVLLLL